MSLKPPPPQVYRKRAKAFADSGNQLQQSHCDHVGEKDTSHAIPLQGLTACVMRPSLEIPWVKTLRSGKFGRTTAQQRHLHAWFPRSGIRGLHGQQGREQAFVWLSAHLAMKGEMARACRGLCH